MVSPEISWGMFESNKPRESEFDEVEQQQQQPQQSQQQSEQKQPEKEDVDWGQFQTNTSYQGEDENDNESMFGWLTRNVVGNAARFTEGMVGRTGNAIQFLQDTAVNYPMSTGLIGYAIHEMVGDEKWKQLIIGKNPDMIGSLSKITSNDLKKATDLATGGYTKPRTSREKSVQTLSSDVGTMTRGIPNSWNTVQNTIGIPLASNGIKQISNELGFKEDKGDLLKGLAWLGFSLAGNVSGSQHAAENMNAGRNGYGPNVRINVPRYETGINRVSNTMLQGDPRSQLAQGQITGIRNDLASGQTSMRDLMTRYDAINATKRDKGLFALGKTDREAAKYNINQVLGIVREEIQNLGASNPQALQSWNNGVGMFATIHKSNSMETWAKNLAQGPYSKALIGPAAGLFTGGVLAAKGSPAVSGSITGISAASYQTSKVLYRVWDNEHLRKYYWEALDAQAQENAPAFFKYVNKLNHEYEKKYQD